MSSFSTLAKALLIFSISFVAHATVLVSESQTLATVHVSDLYTSQVSQTAEHAIAIVDEALTEFDNDTLPHEAKDLRKQLVTVRDMLDVFAHNFAQNFVLWDDVRDALDKGYTVIGNYKDLFDANPDAVEALRQQRTPNYPDAKKVKERRNKVLAWKEQYFRSQGIRHQIKSLFSEISPLQRDVRNEVKFSRFFWGGVDNRPSELLSPSENAKLLAQAQGLVAREEHSEFLHLEDPTSHSGELLFHDHRKRLRTIVKICNIANKLKNDTCNTAAMRSLADLVTKLGDIEDLIITGRHFEDDNKNSKAKDAYQSAIKKFTKLKMQFVDGDMLEPLENL
jgi:hypothetical protein